MIKTYLTGYPWDLMDADAGDVLDRIHGEVGASGVAVWVGMGPLTRIRLPGHEPRVMHTNGGLFFQPDEDLLSATRLKPIVSSGMRSRDWTADLSGACTDRGLSLRAVLACSNLGRVAQRHPEMACKNVFGGVSQYSVCLVNPDVAAFFDAVVADLAGRGVFDSIVLADTYYSWSEARGAFSPADVPLGGVEQVVSSVCFCESCLQSASAAGVDTAAARRCASVMLDAFFTSGTPCDRTLSAALVDREPLRNYLVWRGRSLSTLWHRLAQSCACDVVVERAAEPAAGFQELDFAAPDAVLVRATPGGDVSRCAVASAKRSELHIPATMCVGDHGPELVATMARAGEAGITAFQIDGGTTLPESGLAAVKQAIRFVKRHA